MSRDQQTVGELYLAAVGVPVGCARWSWLPLMQNRSYLHYHLFEMMQSRSIKGNFCENCFKPSIVRISKLTSPQYRNTHRFTREKHTTLPWSYHSFFGRGDTRKSCLNRHKYPMAPVLTIPFPRRTMEPERQLEPLAGKIASLVIGLTTICLFSSLLSWSTLYCPFMFHC